MKSKWMRIPALCLALLLLGTAATVLSGAAELSVVFEENFDEYEGDVNASATKLATFFHVDANAIGDGYVRVEEDPSNGNLYLKNHVFTQVYSKTGIRDPYEFAMTVYEMQGGHQAGVFFRAPACECAYYEGDGGDPDNQTSTGRSGIWVFVYQDRISVNIKAFDNSKPAKVANIYHAFPLPEGSDYGKGIELRIIDNGTDAQIMADGTLVCTLKFSEETGRKWTQNGIDRAIMLFKTVTMLGADGAEILTASDTYVSATESTIGWEGYDFVVNRARDSHYVSVESLADGWRGRAVGQALYTVSGNRMTVRVSKAALGVSGELTSFLFKWADNSTTSGNVMEFMDLGDTAPNDRFAYLYEGKAGKSRNLTYTLPGESLRDETQPLPGMPDWTAPGETETGTETASESGAGTETSSEATTGGDEPEQSGKRVLKYSVFLKGCIVLTGGVLGLCAFVLIAIPDWKRDKKKKE